MVEEVRRVAKSLATKKERLDVEEATTRKEAKESAHKAAEVATIKKAQDATMPQIEEPLHTTSATDENDKTNEYEVLDQVEADVLLDDIEVSGEEGTAEEEPTTGSKKTKVDKGLSQPGRFK